MSRYVPVVPVVPVCSPMFLYVPVCSSVFLYVPLVPALLAGGWWLRCVWGGAFRLGAPTHFPGRVLLQSPSPPTGWGQYAAELLDDMSERVRD